MSQSDIAAMTPGVGANTVLPGLDQAAICECFNRVFGRSHRTLICGGGLEPDYIPATQAAPAELIARQDFAASALHEIAHWCVAGARRRCLPDYGYRYTPPPRGAVGQAQFFALERRVQAVELLLARRAGVRFVVSADDPDFCLVGLREFEQQVRVLADGWEAAGELGAGVATAPPRALQFAGALLRFRVALSQDKQVQQMLPQPGKVGL